MKGIIVAFLVALSALPAVAAGGVARVIPGTESITSDIDASSRVTASSRGTNATTREGTESGRTTTTRRVVRTISVNNDDKRATGRTADTMRMAAESDTSRANLTEKMNTGGRATRTEAASINANPAVRRAGLTLRPSVAEVGGRAIMADGRQTGSNMDSEIKKLKSSRVAALKTREEQKLDPAAIAEAKDRLEQTAALNKSCQEQYNDCMDQFCAVIDANQKRCSCSANLSKYSKVEKAVKDANTQLNEVAQNIRYVGLSADEISAIMSATEAEEALSNTTDTTESRSMLAEIEKMIKDPTTTSSSSFSSDSYGLLDIDLDFSDDDLSDLFSLDFLNNSGRGFSSLRGTELYNAAKKRCNTVITQCKEVGATAQQITGNYDLAIDKDCIAYEQGLTKMNETLVSNVRSATRMLQKARLAVLQNQNTYNARECIGALETCMTDDMVCGENYTKCLDPTKKYIDENGNVVLGKDINTIQNFMTNYNNASIDLATANNTIISEENCGDDGKCVVKYLLSKIGTGKKATDNGLCRPVLDKCRAYTYDANGNYLPYNDIVVNYIQRAMVNIKAAQYKIVSDYASTCLTDIATCYNDQVSQLTSWSATAAVSNIYKIMSGACRNVALTCAYAVFADDSTSSGCPKTGTSAPNTCIQNISQIFYQSLLCPDNSVYVGGTNSISENNRERGYVNAMCQCKINFVTFNGQCLPQCDNGGQYLSTGVCSEPVTCPSGQYWYKSACRSCPANSVDWSTGGNVLGGYCKCDDSNATNPYLPSSDGLSCKQCPSNSSFVGTDGNVFNGYCKCDDSNATDPYLPSYNNASCRQCPRKSDGTTTYNARTGKCVCEEGKVYDQTYNTCFTVNQGSGTGSIGNDN